MQNWIRWTLKPNSLIYNADFIFSNSLQTIVRGSFIGHGDYISHVIAEMSRLSVSSSNSLRRSSPSARKRAQSLGRLGELPEDESYAYEVINHHDSSKAGGRSNYWQDRIQQVCSKSGSPELKRTLQRAKSICEVGTLSDATPPLTPVRSGVIGMSGGQYARSEVMGLRQRPISCHNSPQTVETNNRLHLRLKPAVNHLPDLLSSSRETPRRPCSSYNLKVGRSQLTLQT